MRSDELPTIHGENENSLAAIMEYIQQPNHPFYQQAKERADEFLAAHRRASIERTKRDMQEQIKHMDAAEWSRIVD
jgi:hypothetical protein